MAQLVRTAATLSAATVLLTARTARECWSWSCSNAR